MALVSLRAAILGFLRIEPTTGYTLNQRIEGSVGAFWTVTQSQIYRELHALERDGLAVAHREPGEGKPDRKVYALSDAGHAALDAWLREPLEPLKLRHPLLLKLVLAAEVEPEALDEVLRRYAASVAETRNDYAARSSAPEIFSLARSEREADLWRLSIEHGLAWCEAELAWLDRARKTLEPAPAKRKKSKRGRSK